MSQIRAEKICKTFGGLTAVNEVSFSVSAGQIKALIGPNGAGKTTIFNILCGIDAPETGRVFFKDKEITGKKPFHISSLGIGRTFQHSLLFDELSLVENVMVGCHAINHSTLIGHLFGLPKVWREERDIIAKSMDILRIFGLEERAFERAKNLPHGERHLLEIARALATEPELLLLDEPAAGLNLRETHDLGKLIKKIRDSGITVLLVEHDMRLVVEISDEVVVLDYGKKIAEGSPRLIMEDENVIAAYLGGELDA